MVSILSTAVLGTTLAGRMFFSSTVLFSEPATNTPNPELRSEPSSLAQILVLQVRKRTVESLRVQSPSGQLLLLHAFRLETQPTQKLMTVRHLRSHPPLCQSLPLSTTTSLGLRQILPHAPLLSLPQGDALESHCGNLHVTPSLLSSPGDWLPSECHQKKQQQKKSIKYPRSTVFDKNHTRSVQSVLS